MQTLARSLPAPVVQPPAKSRYSQSLYAPGSNDPEKVRSDDKPTREPFGNEYLTRMITEGRRSDGTLRTSTYPNASQGQLYRNGIGRSELVPREPGNSQGYQSKNSTFIIPGSTTQPQRMDNIPLLDCMAAMTGATAEGARDKHELEPVVEEFDQVRRQSAEVLARLPASLLMPRVTAPQRKSFLRFSQRLLPSLVKIKRPL